MDYGILAVNISKCISVLEDEKDVISKIEFLDNWSSPASERFKNDLDEIVTLIEQLAKEIESVVNAAKSVDACKTEDSKIRTLNTYAKSLNYDANTSDTYTVQKYQSVMRDINTCKNIRKNEISNAKSHLSSVHSVGTTTPAVIPVVPKYDYSDLMDIVCDAYVGYSTSVSTANKTMQIATSVGATPISTIGDEMTVTAVSSIATTSAAETAAQFYDAPGSYSYTKEEVADSGTKITSASFYAPYMNGKSCDISSEALEDPTFNKMIQAASNCKNVKYSLGANASPSDGYMDCSSFVTYVLNQSGYKFERTNCVGLKSMCKSVSASELQPGDLIFFQGTYKSGISHVGIYIGDGKMIHCNKGSSFSGVNIQSFTSGYWKEHLAGYGRME